MNTDANGQAGQNGKDTSATTPEAKATPAQKTEARPARRGTGRALARLFLLLLVTGGLAIAGWFGWQWLERERTLYTDTLEKQAREIARLEADLDRLAETRVAQDDFEALGESLANAQAALGERMAALSGDMEALQDAAQGGRRDLVEAEIEYLLRIAADELYLAQDVDTAIYALQAADDRLRQLADPRLNPVRQLIADHLQALGAVNLPDVSGMALKIGALMRQAAELPLRQARHVRALGDAVAGEEPADNLWQRIRAGMSRVFDRLVVVQRAEPPPPLLTPEQHFFLYRNVELQLASARAALLAGDVAAYRQSLELAREWLNRYFHREDPAVAQAVADISGLLDAGLQPALPDITPALERFRALTATRSRNAGARGE